MKKHSTFKSLVVISALLSMGTSSLVAGGELVQNGSFENFTVDKDRGRWKLVQFDNWTGAGEVWNHKLGRVATNGTYKAELDVGRNLDSLSQSISTVNGETYVFTENYGKIKSHSSSPAKAFISVHNSSDIPLFCLN